MVASAHEYLTLTQASKICPGRPHSSALWRWIRSGVEARSGQRIRLSHIRVGRTIYTTRTMLDEFFRAVAAADTEHYERARLAAAQTIPRPCPARRQNVNKAHSLAVARLEQDGI